MTHQQEELVIRCGFDAKSVTDGLNSMLSNVKRNSEGTVGHLAKINSSMTELGHSTSRTKLHLAEMIKSLTSGNIEGAVMSFSRLSAHLGSIGRFVFGLGGAITGGALLAFSKAKERLAEINAELDKEGEIAGRSIGDMKKSWTEATVEGAKSAFEMEKKIISLARAQATLKDQTDAAIKSLHAQQALEQEAISASSGAQIAKVNRLEEMGLITPEQAILSRSDIKSKAQSDIEASRRAAQQAEVSKLTVAFLGADAATTDLQKNMAGAQSAAFSSPSAIGRNATLKDIPRQRAAVQSDLEERRKQLAAATARLEGSYEFKRASHLQTFLGSGGARNDFQDRMARDQLHDAERFMIPMREAQADAQRFVELDAKLLTTLDERQSRLGAKQDALAAKYDETVKAYEANIGQVNDLSKTLDDLTGSIQMQNRFAPGIAASNASQNSNDTAAALVRTNIGRALIGAQRISADLFARKMVSPADLSALTGVESIIAGHAVNAGTAANMARATALNPSAFENHARRLEFSLDRTPAPQTAAILNTLASKIANVEARGTSGNPMYTRIMDTE